MAKRKRLSLAALNPGGLDMPDTPALPSGPLETKAHNDWVGVRSRAPIADISGDAAAHAAFEEVSQELLAARAEGRMVLRLPLEAVAPTHLVRDRVVMGADDMAALTDSLRARGQQTPIEVLDLGNGSYGLISGWRRLTALQDLYKDTGEVCFATVQALLRRPEDLPAAYLAMVEENEIRADLSFYERARIAVQATGAGVFEDVQTAVHSLFAAARAPKRSKIIAFTHLVEQLDGDLRFPTAVPEKVGLALVAALQGDIRFRHSLITALLEAAPETAAAERAVIDQLLWVKPAPAAPQATPRGVALKAGKGRVTLMGQGVDAVFLKDLRDWLAQRETKAPC